ncbi:5-oxoprolinase subunit C family protein [Lysinibacillus piscis]|uniref:Carboxyltransferase domain-containing protein n=1 Tax=Lysinibacillus piscis TaxID=2518931 RepID=A0ABQ5NFD4_9BACI|nr:biotin-dependent carboxyltransferase family protein [Lysinibacillus sp. KH24]GLC86948.1 hypothetical protein LYSBPC_00750 [Lysinibacillus sp. KH24]
MRPLLLVRKQGVYGSLQDQGRYGYRAYGVPTAGAMDRRSFQASHLILGHTDNETSLELFIGGFEFEALAEATYVLTGAESICLVNGLPIEMWKTFQLKKGDRLTIQRVVKGAILYLTPYGGFQAEQQLGSRSCFPLGHMGESLQKGHILYGQSVASSTKTRGLYAPYRPQFESHRVVRAFKGPHFHLFSIESQQQFIETTFQFVSGNRMGYYLKGGVLQLQQPRDILSEATQFGTIQVPKSGEPIVLMADAQTVGGYPIIATVHEDDLDQIAQMRRLDTVKFTLMEV